MDCPFSGQFSREDRRPSRGEVRSGASVGTRALALSASIGLDLLPSGLYRRPRSFTGSWELEQVRIGGL